MDMDDDKLIELERTNVDWIILADAAEVVNGKLYLLGGGWDTIVIRNEFPAAHRCGIAVAFRVPWTETNQRKQAEIRITDQDGRESVGQMSVQFEVGRPPGITPGQSQRVQIALNLSLPFPRPGVYAIAVHIDGVEMTRATLNVVHAQG